MYITFNDLTTSTAIYNQDGQGIPLVPGHGYGWDSWSYGYNMDGDLIAISLCELISFGYKVTEGVVSNVNAVAVTTELGLLGYYIDLACDAYYGATNYKAYRSVNGGTYALLSDSFCREFPPDDNWHNLEGGGCFAFPRPPFFDDDVSLENTYSYYVIACGDGWETAPSEITTIDTWLPPCSLISPHDNSEISEPNPTFTWNTGVSSLPYGSICSGKNHLFVYDQPDPYQDWSYWLIYLDDIATSSATYNQDGQADPLVAGHNYQWRLYVYGYDENGNLIAKSESEHWNFDYIEE